MFRSLTLNKIIYYLLLLFLFLLPWQVRYIYEPALLNGVAWEYGSGSWYATEVLLWVIILLSFVSLLKNKELFKKISTKEHWQTHKNYLFIYLLAIGYALLAIFNSINSQISFNFVFHILEGACLVAVVVNATPHPGLPPRGEGGVVVPLPAGEGRVRVSSFLFALWLGGVLQGLLAIWQFFSLQVFTFKGLGMAPHLAGQLGDFVVEAGGGRWLRAYGSFGSPNILGGFLAVVWVVGWVILLYWGRGERPLAPTLRAQNIVPLRQIFLSIGQLIILSGLILSFSRSAWLAAGVGAVVATAVGAKGLSPLRAIGKQLLLSFIIILFFFINLNPLFNARINGEGRLEEKSINSRVSEYQEVLPIIKQNFWFGVGPGAYTLALYRQNPTRPPWQYQPVHNIYLLALAEIGIVGCFLVFLFSCFIICWLWKYNRLFLSILIVILTAALFDHWLWSLYIGQMLGWTIFGLSFTISNRKFNN